MPWDISRMYVATRMNRWAAASSFFATPERCFHFCNERPSTARPSLIGQETGMLTNGGSRKRSHQATTSTYAQECCPAVEHASFPAPIHLDDQFQPRRQGASRRHPTAGPGLLETVSGVASTHSRIASLLQIAVAIFITLAAADARAAFEPKDATWQGTSELIGIAREARQRARQDRRQHTVGGDAADRRALGAASGARARLPRSRRFPCCGGRLGLLDDYGKADALLRRFRIHRVSAPFDPREPLRDNPNLPIAVPALGPDGRPHPVVGGVDRVVTNHPTGLETDRGLRLTTVLEMPSLSAPPTSLALIGVIGDAKRCGLVSDSIDEQAASGAPVAGRCGRLLAMGDPSAVMNLMLRYPGNRAFAARLVDYLGRGDDTWGRRSGNLYFVANDFAGRGSYGKHGGLSGAIDDRLEALARLVAETRRDGLPATLAVLLAALCAGEQPCGPYRAPPADTEGLRREYARPTPLVAQGGLAGRAAVLSADTTHRALVVLELKAALEEAVRERMGIPDASLPRLAEEIDRQSALSRRNSEALRKWSRR